MGIAATSTRSIKSPALLVIRHFEEVDNVVRATKVGMPLGVAAEETSFQGSRITTRNKTDDVQPRAQMMARVRLSTHNS